MHQNSPMSALRLTKQVPRELGRLPRSLTAKHRSGARLAKHAAAYPVPPWEQYPQRGRRRHRRCHAARFWCVEHCFGTNAAQKARTRRATRRCTRRCTTPMGHLGCAETILQGGSTYLMLERNGPLLRIEPVNRVLKSHVT